MSKTEDAHATVRAAILDCRLPPEAPLAVSSLKARFGFGWTPLREALSRLEAERLVEFQPNKGYRVAGVSAASLRDLQEARRAIEIRLLSRAIDRGGEDWEAQIVAAHHLLAKAPAPFANATVAEVGVWEARHDAFHAALLAGAEAPWLAAFAAQVAEQLRRHHRFMLRAPEVAARLAAPGNDALRQIFADHLGLAHHSALMEATLARDTARAEALLIEHIGFSLAVYEALWPQAGG
ncbi:GntR family transcriptional regulator [Polymorphum gilvum]|uniref:Transcriptional regulator, GntR family n=1 Tax=Polymorphum gilvum (strain LMG 25793 / CGMCC 1.9160 / SL003B-26A1) TaxID=991905 RepID=F2J1U6_POLGS|nr:GntR family transcriptional regulator [Polymorphum gilvum]ADZ72007.1 Transcriptional regulator, GntR family [Polymorphum gilvum SL003B-26A1]